MPSVILTAILVAAIFFYVGRIIYKSIKRAKEGKFCCGNCGKCPYNKDKRKK